MYTSSTIVRKICYVVILICSSYRYNIRKSWDDFCTRIYDFSIDDNLTGNYCIASESRWKVLLCTIIKICSVISCSSNKESWKRLYRFIGKIIKIRFFAHRLNPSKTCIYDFCTISLRKINPSNDICCISISSIIEYFYCHKLYIWCYSCDSHTIRSYCSYRSCDMSPMKMTIVGVVITISKIIPMNTSSEYSPCIRNTTCTIPHMSGKIRMIIPNTSIKNSDDNFCRELSTCVCDRFWIVDICIISS